MKDSIDEQEAKDLEETRDKFIVQWGVIGTNWGISRTMAQIHALLMTSRGSMSTDQVMESLEVSRGNAHTNLKELVGWGLVSIVTKKGDRKEYFEAEKDVWEICRRVVIERKRREIDPALQTLRECYLETEDLESEDAQAFNKQMQSLADFAEFAGKMGDRVSCLPHGKAMKIAAKLFI